MKQTVIDFLTEKFNTFTSSEKKLCEFMLNNVDKVLSYSVHTLAKDAGVSVATVVRFAQRFGFDGYKEFRLNLATLSADKEDFVLDFEKRKDADFVQVNKVLTASKNTIDLTLNSIDYELLKKVSSKIYNADKVVFFGIGTSRLVCDDASNRFCRVGKNAVSVGDLHKASFILSNCTKDSLVLCVSHSGETKDSVDVIKLAKTLNLKTVAVTSFIDSKITEYADHVLLTQTRESPLHKIAITSRVSQFAMIDALFMSYFSAYYEECANNINKVNKAQKELNIL